MRLAEIADNAYEEARLAIRYAPDVIDSFLRQWTKHIRTDYKPIEEIVDETMRKTNGKRINIIGHSLGGLVSLAYTMENPDKVAKCITVASPINGAPAAPLLYALMGIGIVPRTALQMTPGSKLINAMKKYFKAHNSEFMEKGVVFENIRSVHDPLCPHMLASLEANCPNAWNITEHTLRWKGHAGTLHDKFTCRILANTAAYSFYPTVFVPGFGLGRHSFRVLVESLKGLCPGEAGRLDRLFMASYDYTKQIKAEKIMAEYGG